MQGITHYRKRETASSTHIKIAKVFPSANVSANLF